MSEISFPQEVGPTPAQISLPWPSAVPEFDPGISRDRAETMSYAGTLPGMTVDDIHGQIQTGNEDQLRQKAAEEFSNVQAAKSSDKLRGYIDQNNDWKTPEFASIINEVTNPKQYTPDSVVEKAWAQQFLSNWSESEGKQDWMDQAQNTNAHAYDIAGDYARDFVAKHQYAIKRAEEASARAHIPIVNRNDGNINPDGVVNSMRENLSLFANIATLGTYSEMVERSPDSQVYGLPISLMGTALEDERQKMYAPGVSFEQFQEQYDKRFNEINSGWFSNPGYAAHWASAMVGQGVLAKDLENLSSALNIGSTVLPAAASTIGAMRVIRAANTAGSTVVNATAPVIAGALAAPPNAATAATAIAGNTAAAGAARASRAVVSVATNNAGQMANDARNALQSTFGVAEAAQRADPGAMGTEVANRLADNTKLVGQTMVKLLEDHTKVEANPAIETSNVARSIILANLEDTLPGSGVKSTILDIKEPYKHPITGDWYRDYIIGDTSGKAFDARHTAESFRDDYLKLPNAEPEAYGRKWILRLPAAIDISNPKLHTWGVGLGTSTRTLPPSLDFPGSQLQNEGWSSKLLSPITGSWTAPTNLLSPHMLAMMSSAQHGKTGVDTIIKGLMKPLDELLVGKAPIRREVAQVKTITGFRSDIAEDYVHHANGSTTKTIFNGTVMPQATRTVYVKPEHHAELDKHFPRNTATRNTIIDNYDSTNDRTRALTVLGPRPGPGGRAIRAGGERIPYTTEPKIGRHAVELFDHSPTPVAYNSGGGRAMTSDQHYRGVSLGGEINRVDAVTTGQVQVTGAQMRDQWRNMLERSIFLQNQYTPQHNGIWYNSISEIEAYYRQNYNRLPSELEVEAYFNYKDVMHMDYALRNLALHRNMNMNGYRQHKFQVIDPTGQVLEHSDWVYAKVLDEVPQDGHGIINLGSQGQASGSHKRGVSGMVPTTRQELIQKVTSGEIKVLKFWEPNDKPVSGFFGTDKYPYRYAYVGGGRLTSRDLPLNILPPREGGHLVYESPFWLKQANVEEYDIPKRQGTAHTTTKAYHYMGDNVVMPISIADKGRDIAKKLNMIQDQIRHGLAANDFTTARALHNSLGLPFNFDEHLGKYQSGLLNPNEPIFLTNDRQSIMDLSEANLRQRYGQMGEFHDQTKADSDAKRFSMEFSEERSNERMFTLTNRDGTGNRPLYKMEDAPILDPTESVNRALYRITNNIIMDDAKRGLTYQWLAQAAPYLNVSAEELWAAPIYWLENATFRPAGPGESGLLKRLEAARYMIRSFNGVPSAMDSMFAHISQGLANNGYKYMGEKDVFVGSEHALEWVKDKGAMSRAFIYHTKLGLMNAAIFFANINQVPYAMAIGGPRRGLTAFYSAVGSMMAQMNRSPFMLQQLDLAISRLSRVTKYTFAAKPIPPGRWLEAEEYKIKSGVHLIGTEHSLMQKEYTSKGMTRDKNKVLNALSMPFKASEMLNISTAWHIAWDEFRDKKPLGIPTAFELNAITRRTTLLSGNMRNFAKSRIEKGAGAWVFQFGSYPLRVAEMLRGRQLTGIEKARLLFMMGAMYGVTNPIQQATLLPVTAAVDRYLLDDTFLFPHQTNYRRGNNFLLSVLNEGIPAAAIAYLTGHGNALEGNWYNIKNRFGGNGFSILNDFFYSDRTALEIFSGPAGSVIRDSLAAADPYWRALKGQITGNEEDRFALTPADFMGPIRTVNSINSAYTAKMAYDSGNWLTRNGNVMESGVSQWDAIFMGLTGLRHQSMDDSALLQWSMKSKEEQQKFFQSRFIEEWHRWIQAVNDNNDALADTLFKNAKVYLAAGDWKDEERGKILSIASEEIKPLIDRVRLNFYLNKAPQSKRNERFEMLQQLNIDKEKGAR